MMEKDKAGKEFIVSWVAVRACYLYAVVQDNLPKRCHLNRGLRKQGRQPYGHLEQEPPGTGNKCRGLKMGAQCAAVHGGQGR